MESYVKQKRIIYLTVCAEEIVRKQPSESKNRKTIQIFRKGAIGDVEL